MKLITLKDLKPYQTQAAGSLAAMIQEFPSERITAWYSQIDGKPLPLLCRLRAITGAGKTPILAVTADQLGNAIILWTTNRGSVIAQTKANLSSGGKYADLLPDGTDVYDLSEMGPSDWTEAMSAETGLTILLATVASFNQDGDKLKIHQELPGDTTHWKMLGGIGPESRTRPLYVFYDEGHGATANQFRRLRELGPKAFLLASASPLPDEFNDMIPGTTPEEKSKSLEIRTVPVPTQEVVAAGLLKTRLYLVDCNIAQSDAVAEANLRWQILAEKFAKENGEIPVACFIVNGTERGVDIWEDLVGLGVPPNRIAVHLNSAEAVMVERRGMTNGLIDTYKAKKAPEDLKAEGYTHLIWNLTLREGWDEPMAYVAYLDDKGRSTNDMVQKIGRFVRQPEAKPFDDPDLNSAYFYFNVSDQEFETLLRDMQKEMTIDGYEIIAVGKGERPKTSRLVEVKIEKTIPAFDVSFGDNIKRVDAILLDDLMSYVPTDLQADGNVTTRVVDTKNLVEEEALRTSERRDNNASISVFSFLISKLTSWDKRFVGRYNSKISEEAVMRQRLQFGSKAISHMAKHVATVRDNLNSIFRLVWKGRHGGTYTIKPFNLVSPDITNVSPLLRDKYRVRSYKNAVHAEYNGLNAFEVQVAEALDATGLTWCRNPSQTGYNIPIAEFGAETENFYPDFLLWTEKEIWAIDPKGNHLKEAAAQNKLLDLTGISGVSIPVRVALILEGSCTLTAQGTWVNDKKAAGFTLVRRIGATVKTKSSLSLTDLIESLIEN
ncbi:MAG: DEAD/DEAH box helicase family protein [Janthinobacterium lividum]